MIKNSADGNWEKNEVDSHSGEIDLGFIFSLIYKDRVIILFLCVLMSVLAYAASLAVPNKYKATVILAPTQKDGGGQLGGLASQYGGLAAMAGISLGKESDKTDQAIALLKSWPFLDFVISKYGLDVDVFAAKGYDKENQKLIYDANIYDEKNKKWIPAEFEKTGGAPSSWMLYKKLIKLIDVQYDKKTGLLTLSMTHISPSVAKRWLDMLTKEINLHFQLIDKGDAKRNIEYLEKKIAETSVAEMQSVFFGMVEAQTKALMLTERSEDYLFKTIVRPMVPEEKVSPARSLIAALGFVAGFIIWCCIALARYCRFVWFDKSEVSMLR